MNKLLFFEGGQPLTTDDMNFMQTSMQDAVKAIAEALADERPVILSGIGSGTTVQPGAVAIDGEVLTVEQSLSGSGKYLCFRQVDSQSRSFKDGSTHKVYRKYEAYLSDTTDGAYKYAEKTKLVYLADILQGYAAYELATNVSLADGVSGAVRRNSRTGAFLVSVSKPSSESSLVFTYPTTTLESTYAGVGVEENTKKIVSLFVSLGQCNAYNADGTEYQGALTMNNVILR